MFSSKLLSKKDTAVHVCDVRACDPSWVGGVPWWFGAAQSAGRCAARATAAQRTAHRRARCELSSDTNRPQSGAAGSVAEVEIVRRYGYEGAGPHARCLRRSPRRRLGGGRRSSRGRRHSAARRGRLDCTSSRRQTTRRCVWRTAGGWLGCVGPHSARRLPCCSSGGGAASGRSHAAAGRGRGRSPADEYPRTRCGVRDC